MNSKRVARVTALAKLIRTYTKAIEFNAEGFENLNRVQAIEIMLNAAEIVRELEIILVEQEMRD